MGVLKVIWKIITFPFVLLIKLFDLLAQLGSLMK